MRVVTPPKVSPEVSLIVTRSVSPWFISRVSALGVAVASFAVSGPGGPVGIPSFWMKAKLVVSVQLGFSWPLDITSRLLMCSEAHQRVRLQLTLLMNGVSPGG